MTGEFQYALKFHLLTCISVVHLPDWTWSHQQDQILCSMLSSWSAALWTSVN